MLTSPVGNFVNVTFLSTGFTVNTAQTWKNFYTADAVMNYITTNRGITLLPVDETVLQNICCMIGTSASSIETEFSDESNISSDEAYSIKKMRLYTQEPLPSTCDRLSVFNKTM